MDVVAPGVLIPTTDRQGSSGYNPPYRIHPDADGTILSNDYSEQDYTVWFNGTSAAAPHVSGIAALVLSIHPEYTMSQVYEVIRNSAKKVGGYDYYKDARADGGWHIEMGYGLVDAYKAVREMPNPIPVPLINHYVHYSLSSRDITINTPVKFYLDDTWPGATYEWKINGVIVPNWDDSVIPFAVIISINKHNVLSIFIDI